MQNNNFTNHIRTTNGYVIRESCECCVNISFKNIYWSIHIKTFYLLIKYINELLNEKIKKNIVDSEKVLIGMEGISMMVSITIAELKELSQLLELTFIELKRYELENNFVNNI